MQARKASQAASLRSFNASQRLPGDGRQVLKRSSRAAVGASMDDKPMRTPPDGAGRERRRLNPNRKLRPWVVAQEQAEAPSDARPPPARVQEHQPVQSRIPRPPQAAKGGRPSPPKAASREASASRPVSTEDSPGRDPPRTVRLDPPGRPSRLQPALHDRAARLGQLRDGRADRPARADLGDSADRLRDRQEDLGDQTDRRGNRDRDRVGDQSKRAEKVIDMSDEEDGRASRNRPATGGQNGELIPNELQNNLRRALETFRQRAYDLMAEVDGDDAERRRLPPALPPPGHFRHTNAHGPHAHWAYKGHLGPTDWPATYPAARGNRQSPIDIDTSKVVFDPALVRHPLRFTRTRSASCTIENNGHSFQVSMDTDYQMSGGPLSFRYAFAQLHFHWGMQEHDGSEHRVDGRAFASELHIVFYNCVTYESAADAAAAANDPHALAVVGILIDSGGRNATLDSIIRYVPAVAHQGDRVDNISTLNFDDLFPDHPEQYYTYPGSLTTPPCHENVTWILMRHRMTMSHRQIEIFRRLMRASAEEAKSQRDAYLGTTRPCCPLGDRIVNSSFRPGDETPEPT